MRDDQETEASLRFDKRETERKGTVQDVRVEGKGVEPDELGNAVEKSL
jgi:hypothetical protein